MRIIIGILLIGLFTTCTDIAVTDNEVKAVQSVLDFYGGECLRHKGVKTINLETQTYFELEMSKSELLESYSSMLEMPASNIAFLFYSNLNDEQDNYTHVKVKINLQSGKSSEYYYSAKELKEIGNLTPILQSVSEKIKNKKYNELLSQFDKNDTLNLTEDQIGKYCFSYDSTFGELDFIQFQGFEYPKEVLNEKSIIILSGIMIRKSENTPIRLFIDRRSKKILKMKFEF